MPSHPNAALLNEGHLPFPEPLIPQGESGEAETSKLRPPSLHGNAGGCLIRLRRWKCMLGSSRIPAWAIAVQANLDILAMKQPRFAVALRWLDQAFLSGQDVQGTQMKSLVDRTLGELLRLSASLGDVTALDRWLRITDTRSLRGAATEARKAVRIGFMAEIF